MDNNLTYIAVVLDESGSMGVVRDATIEGFNAFVTEQAKQPGEVRATLVKFNGAVSAPVFTDAPLSEVPQLRHSNYNPSGGTALYDAIGQTILSLGQRLKDMPEEKRPGKVIFLIQTDGDENSSFHYTLAAIKEMISHQQVKYNWGFMFLGANIDAFAGGDMLGIARSATLQYTPQSSRNAFKSVSNYMSVARAEGVASATYNSADRDLAVTVDTVGTASN
jgi:hypothetical protein